MTEADPKNVLVRITTVPISLKKLIAGQMRFMCEQGFKVYMISSPYENMDELQANELSEFLAVPMSRRISPFKDLIALIKLVRILRKLKPKIVHTHTPKAGFLGMVAARFAGVPVRLHTVAGLPLMESNGLKRKILEWAEKLTYNCAAMVYPNSKNLEQFIIESKFCKSSKLKVIGNGSSNGIDTAFFRSTTDLLNVADGLRKQYNIAANDFVYIFIGRLVRDKGIEELVTAFSEINTKHNNVRLLLVGPFEHELDPLSKACNDQIEKNPHIITVGYKDDVRPYLMMANTLVFPSYREGFPNVPLQAGCLDLPSIVTNINGCNEIIEDYRNGLIVPAKDSAALKAAMTLILTDENLYRTLKGNARKMVVDRYEQKLIWNLILLEYQNHLKSNGVVS